MRTSKKTTQKQLRFVLSMREGHITYTCRGCTHHCHHPESIVRHLQVCHALLTPTTSLVPGGSTMPEFIVAIDHITYYAVQAEDEVTAIDLVLEDQGLEIASETRDAYITEYESSHAPRHA